MGCVIFCVCAREEGGWVGEDFLRLGVEVKGKEGIWRIEIHVRRILRR